MVKILKQFLFSIVFLVMSAGVANSGNLSRDIRIQQGVGSFLFVDRQGDPSKQILVYTYLPQGLKPSDVPIVFVMHGHSKNAEGYRNTWIKLADKFGFMVVAPLFDSQQWGGGTYSYASVANKTSGLRDESLWSYTVIEHLFDAIKNATGNTRPRYFIYGHSEGGQFVHRLVLLLPNAHYEKAVAANPGWYTMPRFDIKYPYGLKDSPATVKSLKKSLGRKLVLMLGDKDTDPNHKQLRKTVQAMAQGFNRFERGQKFFADAKRQAAELQTSFGWQLEVVHGAAHQNSKMSKAAAEFLFGQ